MGSCSSVSCWSALWRTPSRGVAELMGSKSYISSHAPSRSSFLSSHGTYEEWIWQRLLFWRLYCLVVPLTPLHRESHLQSLYMNCLRCQQRMLESLPQKFNRVLAPSLKFLRSHSHSIYFDLLKNVHSVHSNFDSTFGFKLHWWHQ